jgi:hypothetical protein
MESSSSVNSECLAEKLVVDQRLIKPYVLDATLASIFNLFRPPATLAAFNEKLAAAISRYVEEALR